MILWGKKKKSCFYSRELEIKRQDRAWLPVPVNY